MAPPPSAGASDATMLLGAFVLVIGLALVVWSAARFTEGAAGTARVLAISPFYVGVVVSGLEPENLLPGLAAAHALMPCIEACSRTSSPRSTR